MSDGEQPKFWTIKRIYNGNFSNVFMNCSTISHMRCLYTAFIHVLQNSIPASQHTILSLVYCNKVLYLITDPLRHACHFIFRMRNTLYDYKWCIYEPNLLLSLNIKNRLYIKHRRKTVLYSVKTSLFVTNYRHNLFKPSYITTYEHKRVSNIKLFLTSLFRYISTSTNTTEFTNF